MIKTFKVDSSEATAYIQSEGKVHCVISGDCIEVRTGDDIPVESAYTQVLSSRQFWLAIDDAGLTDMVTAIVGVAPTRVKVEVYHATEFSRTHPLIDQLAGALGKTPEEVDALFVHGATL